MAQNTKKRIIHIMLLCAGAYFISYLTRVNYGAAIAEICAQTGRSKSAVSLATTGSFITYGLGQLVSGWLGDRVNPRYLVFGGLMATATVNCCLPLCGSAGLMTAVWSVNGLAQAMMWPPLVRLMTDLLSHSDYEKAIQYTSWGGNAGAVAVYLLIPACISVANWQTAFFVCGGAAFCMAFIWLWRCGKLQKEFGAVQVTKQQAVPEAPAPTTEKMPRSLFVLLAVIAIAILAQGALRDGVTTWLPSYMADVYHMGSAMAILTGVFLPLFSILCMPITRIINQKIFKNEALSAGVMFGFGMVALVFLGVFFNKGAVLSLALAMVVTGLMHGINFLLICVLPSWFRGMGKVSTVSGSLNFATYIGSALSTWGFAALVEHFGWQNTVYIWVAIAGVGTLICFLCVPRWRRHREAQIANGNA